MPTNGKTEAKTDVRKIRIAKPPRPKLPHQEDGIPTGAVCEMCGISQPLDRCHIIPKRLLEDIEPTGEVQERVLSKLLSYADKNIIILCKNHHWQFDRFLFTKEQFSLIADRVGLMFLFAGHLVSLLSDENGGDSTTSVKKKQDFLLWLERNEKAYLE
jgi:hypothetical protein